MSGRRTLSWYEDQLEFNNNLSNEQKEEYEAEADRSANVEMQVKQRIKDKVQAERMRFEEIKAKVQAGEASAIDLFGIPEFGNDYELSKEQNNYVVYSKVALETQNDRHVSPLEKDAITHYRKLIWDRLYTKYVRTGEFDSLRKME